MSTVIVGFDHAGYDLSGTICEYLQSQGHEVIGTVGPDSKHESYDYPEAAHEVARAVLGGRAEFGVLICGTGTGMAMAANRHEGIRAVSCTAHIQAKMARVHNHANVLCLGHRIVGTVLALDITDAFFTSPQSAEDRHVRRVPMIELDYKSED